MKDKESQIVVNKTEFSQLKTWKKPERFSIALENTEGSKQLIEPVEGSWLFWTFNPS